MSLSPADLLAPIGPIEPSLFPGEDSIALTARVQAYVESAYADSRVVAVGDADEVHEALQDRMAQAFALWRTYSAVYQRMLNEPNAVNITEKGSHAYTDKQREAMKAIADGYLADFLALVPAQVGTVAVRPGTMSVPTQVRW